MYSPDSAASSSTPQQTLDWQTVTVTRGAQTVMIWYNTVIKQANDYSLHSVLCSCSTMLLLMVLQPGRSWDLISSESWLDTCLNVCVTWKSTSIQMLLQMYEQKMVTRWHVWAAGWMAYLPKSAFRNSSVNFFVWESGALPCSKSYTVSQ